MVAVTMGSVTMARDPGEVMDELRRDVARWKLELTRISADKRLSSAIEKLERAVADAEAVLARWDRGSD